MDISMVVLDRILLKLKRVLLLIILSVLRWMRAIFDILTSNYITLSLLFTTVNAIINTVIVSTNFVLD